MTGNDMDIFLNVLRVIGLVFIIGFPVIWIHALANWDGKIEYDEDDWL